MEISFSSRRLAATFASGKSRTREFGSERAQRVTRRLVELHAAPNLEAMLTLPGHCHELHGDRFGQLAVSVTGNYRLIFRPTAEPPPVKPDGGLDWRAVEAITIIELEDYHGD